MFCPPNYVLFTTLWTEFLAKNGSKISERARQTYLDEDFSVGREFGSPLDLVEEVFLRTFDRSTVALCSPDGPIMNLEASLTDGISNFFERATVFESTMISERSEEAGENGEWLTRMGSIQFEAWPHKMEDPDLWAARYARTEEQSDHENLARLQVYHTLPYCFERASFTVPKELPPWAEDALDEIYVKSAVPNFLGYSICLHEKQARKWRSKNISGTDFMAQFGIPSLIKREVGRPSKKEEAIEYYRSIYPNGEHQSWYEACHLIKERFGFEVGEKTLRDALSEANKVEKIGGKN